MVSRSDLIRQAREALAPVLRNHGWYVTEVEGRRIEAALDALAAELENQPAGPPPAESLAQKFHEAYERLAPDYGYETRRESAVPWEAVPEPNRSLMVAVASEVVGSLAAPPSPPLIEALEAALGVAVSGERWVCVPHEPWRDLLAALAAARGTTREDTDSAVNASIYSGDTQPDSTGSGDKPA